MFPLSFRNAITDPEKVIAPIATPRPISITADAKDRAGIVDDPEGGRIKECRRANQHRGHADQRVEGRNQLRHRGHLDAAGGDEADSAADRVWLRRSPTSDAISCVARVVTTAIAMPIMPSRCSATAAVRARQSTQRQDEADAGNQVGDQDPAGEWPRCSHAIAALLLLVHGEHSMGDREAAEDIHAGQCYADEAEPFRRRRLPAAAAAISAPTTITDDMALVTLISGVCSAGVTDQTTK